MKSMGSDVVICGGGVMGAASAYLLAKGGLRPQLIEGDGIASGASGGSAGLVGLSHWDADDPLGPLGRLSVSLHKALRQTLPEESGVDYQYATIPYLFPAFTVEEAESMRHAGSRASGRFRWLEGPEARSVYPWLGPEALGGLYQEDVAQVNSYRFTLALIQAAERRGAAVRSGRVTGFRRQGGRVTAVEVGEEVIAARQVLLALGPWTAQAGAWLGVRLPVEPLRGQIVKLRLPGEAPWCGVFDERRYLYVVPKVDGHIYTGTTLERVGFDARPTTEARDHILEGILRLAPPLASAAVVEQTACLRPLSEDDLPLIGPVPGYENVFVCTGHGRQGILLSTGSATAVVELMTTGRAQCLDLAPFNPARFAGVRRGG